MASNIKKKGLLEAYELPKNTEKVVKVGAECGISEIKGKSISRGE